MLSGIAVKTPSAAEAERLAAQRTALIAILALTLYRVLLAFFDRTELSTDEAQYWFWGQTFDFGAYSKPPLIGWILRVSTDLLGQTVAAARISTPLFHGVTAWILFLLAKRILPARVALLAALCYLTTPAVTLGSALVTTDTPLLFAASLALLAQIGLAQARDEDRRAPRMAVVLGFALGLGLLAKHAMLFWLAGAVIAGMLTPRLRIRLGDAAIALGVMFVVVLPHLVWLAQHNFITLHHIQDITQKETLSLLRPLSFLAEQAAVMGPILFAALLIAMTRMRRADWTAPLAILSLVPLLIVTAQGVKGQVLANWAVLYLVPGSVLAATWLVRHPRLARASLILGLAVALALPLVKVMGTGLTGSHGKPLLARYLGHEPVARWAISSAEQAGGGTLVAQGRDLMADLSWFGSTSPLAFRAIPPQGRPAHHWEVVAPYNPVTDPGPVHLLWTEGRPPPCADGVEVGRFEAPPGYYGGRSFVLLRLDTPTCLSAPDADDE